ncbi:MAG: ribokinase [Oscillospiraceae bacterium]|nr:ribokinase [Oscillospiraceae bacterium]
MKKPRILVVGSANMDIVFSMPRIPNKGESIIAENYSYVPGGKGANAATAIARIGGDAVFCARIGNDETGKKLLEAYTREKIVTRYINADKNAQTGLAAVLLEGDGTNRIIVYPNANLDLEPEDVENAFLSYPDAVLMQFETNPESVAAATEFAAKQNIPVIIDAGPVQKDFPYELLKNVTVMSPNEVETAQITGITPSNADMCLQACMRLRSMTKAKYVVLKLSDRGCCWYDGKDFECIPSHYVHVIDTTAAGDAFTAALTVEYMRTKNLSRACKYANAAGAFAVTKFGAINSFPKTAELDNFILANKIKL